MNACSRNMNYFGEMMLYASFGVLVPRWEVALIYSYMWGVVFYLKMAIKDYQLSKKDGWNEYKKSTWMVLPKINNCATTSYSVYSTVFLFLTLSYYFGGFQQTIYKFKN